MFLANYTLFLILGYENFMRFFQLCLLFSCFFIVKSNAQASWETFGQNRVQFRTFEWNYFDSTHFRAFYYDQGKANAKFCLKVAEQELSHIVYLMGGRLNKKLNIILYNSFSDYRQSNIGRKTDHINSSSSGKLDLVGDNIPVYFNGDHLHLKNQIVRGIATAIKDNMLFGNNIKEIVRNAIKMNIPEWFTAGYISYISNEWLPDMNHTVSYAIQQQTNKSLPELSKISPSVFGHSFWRFLAATYGEHQISNILYLTRNRKSVQTALLNVLKKPAKVIFDEWRSFYANEKTDSLYKKNFRTLLTSISPLPEATCSQFNVSPNHQYISYVEKKDGQFIIWLHQIKYNKKIMLFEGGTRSVQELKDPDYPLTAWNNDGKKIAVLFVKQNKTFIKIFDVGSSRSVLKKIARNKIDRITGMCFWNDDNTLAVTAIKKGISDLYKLSIKNTRFENITNDAFDDKNPRTIRNKKFSGILFSSNRTSSFNTPSEAGDVFSPQFNLFLYKNEFSQTFRKLSNSPTEIQSVIDWNEQAICYTATENQICKRWIASSQPMANRLDSLITTKGTQLPDNFLQQYYFPQTQKIVELYQNGKTFDFYTIPIDSAIKEFEMYQSLQHQSLLSEEIPTSDKLFPTYQLPFDTVVKNALLDQIFLDQNFQKTAYQIFSPALDKMKAKKYLQSFEPDFLQTTLDNTLLFTRYQPYNANQRTYTNPSLNGFFTSTLTDILEDYKITGGFRIGINFNEKDYFFKFNNYRRRVDWEILYYHHLDKGADSSINTGYIYLTKNKLDLAQIKFSYPLSLQKSLHFTFGGRIDKHEILSIERTSLNLPATQGYWNFGKLEFIHDNSFSPLYNIFKGSRAKIFIEYQLQLNQSKLNLFNIGYDARKYITLYKNIILANRIAGAMSTGSTHILYKLGGVDNSLNIGNESNTQVDPSQRYNFQMKSTNLRGYQDGFLNGNSYIVWNEEIRIPIIQTFIKRPVKSAFLRNIQIVGFADFGTAWKSFSPKSSTMESKSIYIDNNNPNVIVYVTHIAGLGYGTGLRTSVLGYFLKADVAWNILGGSKPMLHLSMATDF